MQKLSENTDSVKPLIRRGLGRLPSWLKNKYLLTGSFFILWMFFFDPKDIFSYFERRDKLNELETSQKHLKNLIAESLVQQNLLKNNVQGIEKYARENYMMKKDNEELFIINIASENK